MASFFSSYIGVLLHSSAEAVQQNPHDEATVRTHLALVNLANYLQKSKAKLDQKPQGIAYKQAASKDASFVALLEETAQMENAFALFILGMLKLEGLSSIIERDKTSGNSLVALAALKGCSWAMQAVGNFHMRGDNSFFKQSFVTAEKYFAKALEIKPDDVQYLRNMGRCCLYLGKHRKAMRFLLLAHQQGDDTLKEVYNMYAKKNTVSHASARELEPVTTTASKPIADVEPIKIHRRRPTFAGG